MVVRKIYMRFVNSEDDVTFFQTLSRVLVSIMIKLLTKTITTALISASVFDKWEIIMRLTKSCIPGIILTMATLSTAISSASARQPSNFQGTCKDISIRDNILIASCRRAGTFADYQATSIQLRGIYNDDGELKDDGSDNPASFHLSCQNANPNEEKNTFGFDIETMFANCENKDGKLVYTGIRIQGIENIDGTLTYTS